MTRGAYYPYSWVVLITVAVAYFFSTLVRNDVSTVTPTLITSYSWSPTALGWVNSSYVWAYAIMQIPFGYLSERWWGARTTLTVGTLLVSIGGVVFAISLPSVELSLFARILMGIGSAAILVPANPALSRWFASSRRGVQSAILGVGGTSGTFVGNVATPILTGGAFVVGLSPIQSGFFILAIPIVFVTAGVFFLMRNRPEDVGLQPLEPESEGDTERDRGQSLTYIMKHSSDPYFLTLVYAGYIGCTGVSVWFTLYFVRAYSLELTTAALLFAFISLVPTILGQLIGGFLGDRIGHRTIVSMWTLASGFVMAILALLVALDGRIELAYLVGLLVAFVLFSSGWVNAWPLTTELFSAKAAGPIGGLMNTGGNVAIAAAIVVSGFLISAGSSFAYVFMLSSAFALAGFVGTLFLQKNPRRRSNSAGPEDPPTAILGARGIQNS